MPLSLDGTGSITGIGTFNFSDEIVHVGDTNTKIRFPANDTISFETNGAERLRITNTGKVSLGSAPMTAPPSWLHVKGNTYQTLRLENYDGGANGPYIELYNNSASPADDDYTGIISFKNRNSAAEEITYTQIRSQSTDVTDGTEDGVLTFHTRGNGTFGERLRIDSSGRVQIGAFNNTGSNTKFVVGAGNNINTTAIINTGDVDTDALTLSNWDGSTTSNKVIMHFDNSGHGGFNIGMPAATDAFVIEDDGGSERLRIDSNGMLGIGGSPKTVNTLNTIEIGNSGLFGSQIAARTVEVGTNCYYNSGWKYKHADKASLYYQYQGYHSFETAATGSADGAISFQPRLLIDNNGYVTISNQPSFLVAPANDAQTANGNVTYTTVFHNTGTHYSTSTGRFTAPVTGYYTFGANFTGQAGNQNVFVRFYINGALNQRGQHYSGGGNSLGTNVYMSCDLSGMHTLLQKDDYVQLNLAASTSQGQSSYMRFYGYLVH